MNSIIIDTHKNYGFQGSLLRFLERSVINASKQMKKINLI